VDPAAPNLEKLQSDHCRLMSLFHSSDIFLHFQTQAAQS